METVLLTGFAGFIGSQILRDLIAKGYYVIGVDNMSEGSDPLNFEDIADKFYPLKADIAQIDLDHYVKAIIREENLKGLDYIISCAAQSHVDRCYSQIDTFVRSNINGPINLAKIGLDLRVKKLVHVSTDEVWGEAPQPYTEDTQIMTGNAYASSKASAELFLHNYYKAFGLPLVITNGANTYGARQSTEKLIPKTIFNIIKDKKIPLYQTRAQRMWLHVEDHSSAIIAAMEKGNIGEKYCIAPEPHNELFTDELVSEIAKRLGKDPKEVIQIVPDRPNYDLRYWMLNDKTKRQLGWFPKHNILEELDTIISWYKKTYGTN